MRETDEIDEIMARAMRLRAVEANKILTDPVHIQNYVDTSWAEELPAAQAAHAALEAAGFEILPVADRATNSDATETPSGHPNDSETGIIDASET